MPDTTDAGIVTETAESTKPEVLTPEPESEFQLDPLGMTVARMSDMITSFVAAVQASMAQHDVAFGHLRQGQQALTARVEALEHGREGSSGRLGRRVAGEIAAMIRATADLDVPRRSDPAWRGVRQRVEIEIRRRAGVPLRVRWEDVDAKQMPMILRALDATRLGVDEGTLKLTRTDAGESPAQ